MTNNKLIEISKSLVERLLNVANKGSFISVEEDTYVNKDLAVILRDVYQEEITYPIQTGVYTLVTNIDLVEYPEPKLLYNNNSLFYQIYGLRIGDEFKFDEVACKTKDLSFIEAYIDRDEDYTDGVNLLYKMEEVMNQYNL